MVLPVLDLRRYFGLPSPGITQLDRLVVVSFEGTDLGILADALLGTRVIASSDLTSGEGLDTAGHGRLFKGIVAGACTAVLDAGLLIRELRAEGRSLSGQR